MLMLNNNKNKKLIIKLIEQVYSNTEVSHSDILEDLLEINEELEYNTDKIRELIGKDKNED